MSPGRMAPLRRWLYERTPQLIIVATAALLLTALAVVVALEVLP